VIDPTLYCIASVPSISVAQSATTAAGLSLPGTVAAGAGAAVSAGAGVAAGAGSVAATGATVSVDVLGDLSPQATSASAQAAARKVIRVFMVESSLWKFSGHYSTSTTALS
jgi:hypothetical protein